MKCQVDGCLCEIKLKEIELRYRDMNIPVSYCGGAFNLIKEILEYPDYFVTDTGEVWSKKSGKMKKMSLINVNGYAAVGLFDSNRHVKRFSVHRLVASAFIPNPENKPEVNHIDGDKQNNNVENLEWVTPKENIQHAINTGLINSKKPVNQYTFDGVLVATYESAIAAARAMGKDDNQTGNIVNCCKGIAKSVWGYMWRYRTNSSNENIAPYVDYDTKRSIPVKQITMDGELVAYHESANAAARSIGKGQANIYYCCEHKRHHNSAYGYRWEYVNENKITGGLNGMNINNEIHEEELFDMAMKNLMLYGVNINLQRSIPQVADGLKPVFRRILYAVYKNYRGGKVTVASVIGDTLKFHPHGDLGLKDVIAGLAQYFSNNIPLLDAIGNCGTPTAGDDAAASRYWSIKISPFAMDVLFDEFDGKVNMKPSYDDTSVEPVVMPAKFPIILLNGSSGIGYTLSSDIYPYNLGEIASATIKLLKNPKANVKLIPDLPTGCDVIVRDEETFVMQSSFDVDNVNYIITIRNMPYKRYLKDIHKKLCAIQDSQNPIPEIISADNESDLIKKEIRYVIRCKPCNLYNVINTLFKRVPGFRVGISTRNMLVVDSNFRTRKFTIKQILLSWIDERIKGKRTWFLRKLVALTAECNMLEGKAFMLSDKNLNKTIKIFHDCKRKDEIVPALVKAYHPNVTSSQANYMIDVKMYQLTHEEYEKTIKKIEEIRSEIEYVKDVVENPDKIRDVIINELETIKTKYNFPRRSKVLNNGNADANVNIGVVQILPNGSFVLAETDNPEHLSSDIIPVSGDGVCLIDEKGKFIWVDTTKAIHDTPLTMTSIGRVQMGNCISAVSNLSNDIVLLSNKGRVKYMPIEKIPSNATRKPLIPLDEDEYLVSVLEIHDPSQDILIYTSNGYGKRVQISALNRVSSVDAQGQFLIKDHEVSGMFAINPNKPLLVYVTRLGRMRVNQSRFLSTAKKFGDMKPIIELSPQDDLIAVFCADKEQSVILNHVDGRVTTVHVDSIEPKTLAFPPTRPKHVPGVRVIRSVLS